MEEQLFKKEKHGIRRFFRMLWKARLPYIWIIAYIAASFYVTKIGITTTEYTAQLFAGYVDFTTVVLPFLMVTLLSLVIGSINGILKNLCMAMIDRNMRRMIWKKVVHLPFGFYDKSNPKELISRITYDTSQVSNLIMSVFVGLITSAYSVFATLRRIGSYDTKLMLVLITVLPLNVGIALIVGRMKFGISDIVNKKRAELTEGIAESANNMLLVKSMGTENVEYEKGMKKAKDFYKKAVVNALITNMSTISYTISGMIQFILIVMVGRSFYSSGAISLAEWVAYFAFANSIVNYLSGYCGNWETFKTSQGATNKIASLLLEEEEDCESGEPVSDFCGSIRFENVDFSYDEKNPLFEDLSFEIPEGKITALVGPSGCGKTTILNLIERFYEIENGTIRIGTNDISKYALKEYRNILGYVTQESTMFSGTLRENLLGEEHFTDENILKACAIAGISEYIKSQEDGLDMLVGEGGMNLSGGQKQRLSIARILLKQPKYLLLDEATSAIDIEGKDKVFDGIRSRMEGCTTVMIAHDKQTVEKADHVIVIEDGKVAAQGPLSEVRHSNAFLKDLMREEA